MQELLEREEQCEADERPEEDDGVGRRFLQRRREHVEESSSEKRTSGESNQRHDHPTQRGFAE
jgi:hypothetical protein